MKKEYMTPAARVIAMSVNENIATSRPFGDGPSGNNDVTYNYSMDGTTKYIAFSEVQASTTGNDAFDKYMDKLLMFTHGLFNCGSGGSDVMPI
jgi:hypothetical protein